MEPMPGLKEWDPCSVGETDLQMNTKQFSVIRVTIPACGNADLFCKLGEIGDRFLGQRY